MLPPFMSEVHHHPEGSGSPSAAHSVAEAWLVTVKEELCHGGCG